MADGQLKTVGKLKSVGDEELRQWLETFLAEHPHLTLAELSRSEHIGMSHPALHAYLKGTYFLEKEVGGSGVNPENTKIEDKVRAYRDKVEGTVRHGFKNSFIKTRSWQQFQHACMTAINENVIVIVYAKPGVGKSRCMAEFSTEQMRTRPIEILCSANITTRYFVQKIAKQCSISDTKPTAQLEDLIADKLKKNPRPLFVDQANYLNEKGLGTICYLWERARIPIVLFGTHDLKDLFARSSLTEDVRVQLSSRIAMHYPLKELSREEVASIVTRVLGDRATPKVLAHIYNATHGNHRHLDMVLPRLSQMVDKNLERLDDPEDDKVTMESLIDNVASRLMIG